MVTRSQKIRLGVFLATALSILFISLAIITGTRFFKEKNTYFIRYKNMSLAGLEIGSPVKYRGIRIGRIENIYIDPEDVTSNIVEITVTPKVPIKKDNEAVVTYISYAAGIKMIEILGGSNESDPLPPDSFIQPGQSIVENISGKAEIITEKLELILNNIAEMTEARRQEKLFKLIDNTSNALQSFNTLLDTNKTSLFQTLNNVERFTSHLDTFMIVSNLALKDIREITRSPKLTKTIDNVEKISTDLEQAELSELIKKLADAVEQTNKTFTHLDLTLLKSRHDIISSTEIFRESLEYFNEFTRLISENPSLLLRSQQQEEIPER